MEQIEIARATTDNLNFIRDSWLKSYRDSVWVSGIPSDIYYHYQSARVDALLATSEVYVAHWQKDYDQVYGWISGAENHLGFIVNYAYVKSAFRKLGIGRALLDKLGAGAGDKLTATHRTWSHSWLDSKLQIEYNPYLIDMIVNEGDI